MEVSLFLIEPGKCWFLFSMFGPCTFTVVMNLLHLILLSPDLLFGFTISISQTPVSALIDFH